MLGTLFGGSGGGNPNDTARLVRIEHKLDMILAHLGLEYTSSPSADGISDRVRELLAQGKKIQAIKAYREETGAGLAEAKDAVEAIERQYK